MDALQTLLETFERLNANGSINEGEYLTSVNLLRDINLQRRDDEYHPPAPNPVQRAEVLRLIDKHLIDGRQFHISNGSWIIDFDRGYEALLNNDTTLTDFQKTCCITFYRYNRENTRDSTLGVMLHSKHPLSKMILQDGVKNAIRWRQELGYNRRERLWKTDATTSETRHIIQVNIISPFEETFNMETRLIRLGGNTTLSNAINNYIISKAEVMTKTYIDILLGRNYMPNFSLIVSGIDARTRNQQRMYGYANRELQYTITYLTK